MMRWVDPEPTRLHPQEQALLALCDRMKTLEQAFTAETDALRKITLEQARRLAARLGTSAWRIPRIPAFRRAAWRSSAKAWRRPATTFAALSSM